MIESLKEMAERLEYDHNYYLPRDLHIVISLSGYALQKFKGVDSSKGWEDRERDGTKILLRFLSEHFHTGTLHPLAIYVGDKNAVVYMEENSKEELILDAMYELNAIYSEFLEREIGGLAQNVFYLRPIITQFRDEALSYFSYYRDVNRDSIIRSSIGKEPLPPEVEYGILCTKKKHLDVTTYNVSLIDVDGPADGEAEELRTRISDALELLKH